jgi:glycosyltransferase involved in cell wall biosynthesis
MSSAGPASPLRICIISQEFPPYTHWGGVGVYNGMLAAELARRGHDVWVVSRAERGAPTRETAAAGFHVWRVGVPIHRKRFVGRTVDRILHARAVDRAVRELDARARFDAFETTEAGLEGERLLRRAAYRPRFLIQCNGSNAFGQAAGGFAAPLHALDWRWSFRREQRALALVPRIIVTSEATRSVLLGQGVDPAKLHLVYQGIDTRAFHPRTAPAVAGAPLAVGFVGRLEQRKGIDFLWRLIEAAGPDADMHFHLKGALHPASLADTRLRLERYARWVTHHAPSDHTEMPAFYRKLDVLVQPSRFENFGLAYAEAMSSGVLVIAGIGGSAREVVRDGETGFLVNPDGPIDRALALLRELAADRAAHAAVRAAARADVERRFSLDACIGAKVELYRGAAR